MKRFTVIISISALFLTVLLTGGFTETDGNTGNKVATGIGQNFRIYPSTVSQTETFITKDPTDVNTMWASANAYNFDGGLFISEGIYVTTNGGTNWYGNDTCTGANINFHGGDPGIAIDKNGTFVLTRLGRTPFTGLYSHFSTDKGLTWSPQKTITTDVLERATTTSDVDAGSSFYGRTYSAWVRFSPPYPVFVVNTNDGGQNWTTPLQVNNPPQRCAGGEVAVGINSRVHLTWSGVQGASPFTEVYAGFATSTDGGQNWNVAENIFTMNGIQGSLPQKNGIRVNGLPRIDVDRTGGPRNGWIYIVTTQKNLAPAGTDPDVILNRSTDGGATWSPGIRVNQDPLNDGKIQYFPAIHVDDNGGVNVIYYDDRNTTSDSSGVFLSRSLDGGSTWGDYQISDHNFKPEPIGGGGQGYQGDNIDLTTVGNTMWPVWMDNSVNNIYNVWTVPVDLTSVGIENNQSLIPDVFELKQNYPNPFNPSTTISYNLAKGGFVTLKVYDINGREVKTLVNGKQSPGSYEVEFNAALKEGSELGSGIYFYNLRFEGYSLTRPMVLIK